MRIRAALVAAALAIHGTAFAETLQIPDRQAPVIDDAPALDTPTQEEFTEQAPLAEPDGQAPERDLPLRGMSMQLVEDRFGEPLERLGPVGEPPITRWVYADYTVYFEGRYVIHAVRNRD
jgi:hypothetical protein